MSVNKYNLQNNENFNNNFEFSQLHVCTKYVNIINEYLKQCDGIQIHNNEYKNFIIKKELTLFLIFLNFY